MKAMSRRREPNEPWQNQARKGKRTPQPKADPAQPEFEGPQSCTFMLEDPANLTIGGFHQLLGDLILNYGAEARFVMRIRNITPEDPLPSNVTLVQTADVSSLDVLRSGDGEVPVVLLNPAEGKCYRLVEDGSAL
jgi:hypothetical protein